MGSKGQGYGLRVLPDTTILMQAIPGIPLITAGDDLPAIIHQALDAAAMSLQDGDVLVVSSKIVSKAENRFVDLKTVTPSEHAQHIAETTGKDARIVELILQNSEKVTRAIKGVLLVKHFLGFTSANAGIDNSNVGADMQDTVLLLPENPDASANRLRHALQNRYGVRLGIIISDTHGRPFRFGNIGFAIGLAGIPALIDQRGEHDLFGRELLATITPLADELAAAAGLISGQADEGQPVVLIRGVTWHESTEQATDLVRPPHMDLFG